MRHTWSFDATLTSSSIYSLWYSRLLFLYLSLRNRNQNISPLSCHLLSLSLFSLAVSSNSLLSLFSLSRCFFQLSPLSLFSLSRCFFQLSPRSLSLLSPDEVYGYSRAAECGGHRVPPRCPLSRSDRRRGKGTLQVTDPELSETGVENTTQLSSPQLRAQSQLAADLLKL